MTNVKALEIWTAQTICNVGILLSVVSALLHLGRPYFERILGRLTLRVAADLWWLTYVALRDGTLFLAFVLGFWTLNLDLMADIKIGLPFVPLGTVGLALALAQKVFANAEDLTRAHLRTVGLVAVAATLNAVGYVIVMEAPGDEYNAASTVFWATARSWRSNANPALATVTFYGAVTALTAIAIAAFVVAWRRLASPVPAAGGSPARS
jgi:hypothetical protein